MYEIDFDKFKDIFFAEAKEHFATADAAVEKLRNNSADTAALFDLFRAAHTLKSMAATMGFDTITPLVQEASKKLDKLHKNKVIVTPDMLAVIVECFAGIKALIEGIADGTDKGVSTEDLITKIKALAEVRQDDKETAMIRSMFFSEIAEYLTSIKIPLEQLHGNPANPELFFEVFRIAHTIKSMAATVGYDAILRLTTELSTVLNEFREGRATASGDDIVCIAGCFDLLAVLVDEAYTGENRGVDIEAPIARLRTMIPRKQ
jgi:chemotaxis protein histidine kinase CheA